MYAVIKTGGKQYKVSPGDVIQVELLKATGEGGDLSLKPLLVVTDQGETVFEAERLSEFPVSARVLREMKGGKVTVFKYRSKSGYASKNGHRQLLSLVQITAIGNTQATELKTAEDVEPESTGPQKPAPVEKSEPETSTAPEGSASGGGGEPIADSSGPDTDSARPDAETATAPEGSASGGGGEPIADSSEPDAETPMPPEGNASGGGGEPIADSSEPDAEQAPAEESASGDAEAERQ